MHLRFSRLPELEYYLIHNRKYLCFEIQAVSEEEKALKCDLIKERIFKKHLLDIAEKADIDELLLRKSLDNFLLKRRKVLEELDQKIKPYLPDLGVAYEETPIEEQEREATPEEEEEMAEEEISVLDVVGNNVATFSPLVTGYLNSIEEVAKFLIDNFPQITRDVFHELATSLINLDVLEISLKGLEGKLLVSLDLQPQRLALALNRDIIVDKNRTDRFFIPPIIVRKIGHDYITFHAYRSLDSLPAYIPSLDISLTVSSDVAEKYYNLIRDAQKIFNSIKKAKKGRPPRLLTKNLVDVLVAYVKVSPLARDQLLIISLGAGRGDLLAKVMDAFMDEAKARQIVHNRSTCRVLLNDLYEEEKTGTKFNEYSSSDKGLTYIIEVPRLIEDMRESIKRLNKLRKEGELKQRFDVCFINRVFDIYAKYGFYRFPTTKRVQKVSAMTSVESDIDRMGSPLIYRGLAKFSCFNELERSLLLRQKPNLDYLVLPGLQYELEKDFFRTKGISFEDLLEFSNLVIVSVYPGTLQTIFEDLSDTIKIHAIDEKATRRKPAYAVFYLSKNAKLIDAISSSLSGT